MSPRIISLSKAAPFALLVLSAAVAGCSSDKKSPDGTSARETLAGERDEFVRKSEGKLVIVILKNNRTWFDGKRISPNELGEKMAEYGDKNPVKPVLLGLQAGADPQAATFVEVNARKAGLGAVEVFVH